MEISNKFTYRLCMTMYLYVKNYRFGDGESVGIIFNAVGTGTCRK